MTDVPYSPPQLAKANGIEICYDIFGSADAEPLLLIMGLSAQMVLWDDEFCQQLAARGFRVVRFDNRDIGHSTKLTGGKRITPIDILKIRLFGILPPGDLHAARHGEGHHRPDGRAGHPLGACGRRVDGRRDRPGNRDPLPRPHPFADLDHVDHRQPETAAAEARGDDAVDVAAAEDQGRVHRDLLPGTGKSCARAASRRTRRKDRDRAERCYARGLNPAGVGRQLRAILASGARNKALANVRTPTLVIHGTVDPLVRPEAGKDTANSIPGAKLLMVEGMGHAMPIPMWPQIIGAIADHAKAAARKAA